VKNLELPLNGLHQLRNAGVVVEMIDVLRSGDILRIGARDVVTGLKQTEWPGRFQIVRQSGAPTLVLDVAHNEAGMTALVDTFRRVFPGQKALVLAGFVKRKPHQKMFDLLSSITSQYAIVPLSNKRTIDVPELMSQLNWRNVPRKRFGSLRSGYNYLLKSASDDDIIAVVGSHYLVGEFLSLTGFP
jgi:dihydrofolate synthase/folylpolyglutamate synthase